MESDFEYIFKQYYHKIYRVCLGYLNDAALAKDITQETFITVWQKRNSFRQDANISTWIYKIATNKCLRTIEQEKKILHNRTAEYAIVDTQPEANQNDQLVFLRQLISELPELERIIITLTLEEVKQEEIAEIVGLSHANVRVKVHRIKQKLSKKFEDHGRF